MIYSNIYVSTSGLDVLLGMMLRPSILFVFCSLYTCLKTSTCDTVFVPVYTCVNQKEFLQSTLSPELNIKTCFSIYFIKDLGFLGSVYLLLMVKNLYCTYFLAFTSKVLQCCQFIHLIVSEMFVFNYG